MIKSDFDENSFGKIFKLTAYGSVVDVKQGR